MKPFCGAFRLSRLPVRALGVSAAVSISLVCRAGLSAAPIELPAECGTAADFERELQARSVEPALLEQTQVSVERDSSGYRLRMRVRGEPREFRDADCGALLRAAVVVVVALSEASQRSESPGGAVGTKSQDETVAPRGSADAERARRARFFAGIGAGVNAGLLPRSSALFELETGVSGPHWGLLADARVFPHSATQDSSGHGVSVHAFGGQLAASFFPVDAWRLQAGGGAYRLSGSGLGSALPLTDSAWAIVLTSGASFIPVRRNGFELGFGIEGALHLQRPRFEIRGYREVFRSSVMGGSFFFRLAQSFQ